MMKDTLFAYGIVLCAACLVGGAIRLATAPAANPLPIESAEVERQAAAKVAPLGWAALGLAGLSLAASERWPGRVAGGLLTLSAGMFAPAQTWLWGLGVAVSALLLLIAWRDREVPPSTPAP